MVLLRPAPDGTIDPIPMAFPAVSTEGAAVVAVVVLAAVHLFAGRLRILDAVPRSRVLSLSGGASVASVFVHALPEVARVGTILDRRIGALGFVEGRLERYVQAAGGDGSRVHGARSPGGRAVSDASSMGVFWLHVGSFVAYDGLVGYLLFSRAPRDGRPSRCPREPPARRRGEREPASE